jgi:transketolase C-terminal domain/subunit
MLRIGVDERFGEVGSVDYLKKAFGFDAETITARTRSFVRGE